MAAHSPTEQPDPELTTIESQLSVVSLHDLSGDYSLVEVVGLIDFRLGQPESLEAFGALVFRQTGMVIDPRRVLVEIRRQAVLELERTALPGPERVQ